ncbi:MAG: hypothetical protein AUI12_13660 [Acidobacteria bacterium 13_2_20CM_2_57_6]|nr:MAG: hypothetical protein AUH16_05105 [Acidobacteria bacterium 13_2_20CM_57_7]OLB84438.1 MAG: hypothetical protein AUI12_13660 [Acidobacteria bacterium 13_2_20CM_2_57_6]
MKVFVGLRKEKTEQEAKLRFIYRLGSQKSGSAKTGFVPSSTLGTEILVKRVDSRIQNQVAIGAGL